MLSGEGVEIFYEDVFEETLFFHVTFVGLSEVNVSKASIVCFGIFLPTLFCLDCGEYVGFEVGCGEFFY